MAVGSESEMLDGLAGVLGAAQQDDVASGRVLDGELVQSQALTAGLLDPGTSSGRESQGGNVEFRDGQQAVVIGDGADNGDRLVLVRLLSALGGDFAGNARERHWGSVDARHKQSLENDLVEVGVGAAFQSPIVSVPAFLFFLFPLGIVTYEQGSGRASPRA